MTTWLDAALVFEPSQEMKRRLNKNKETFAQYVVRMMSYSCPECRALPGVPCDAKIAASSSCGVQFHRGRSVIARCPVTTHFLK